MKKTQESKLKMYQSVHTCCISHQAVYNTNLAFKNGVTALRGKIESIETQNAKLAVIIKAVAAEKDQLRRAMCSRAAEVAGIVFAFATVTNNAGLKEQCNFSARRLERLTDETVADTCTMLHGLADSRSAELQSYGLHDTMLDALSDAIDDYRLLVEKPKTARSEQTATRRLLEPLYEETDSLLRGQLDKLITLFRNQSPEFVQEYRANRSIIDHPVTHTRIRGLVTNAQGNPIAGALLKVENSEFSGSVETDENGNYDLRAKFGVFLLEAEKTGYNPFSKSGLKIKRGKINHFDFVMRP